MQQPTNRKLIMLCLLFRRGPRGVGWREKENLNQVETHQLRSVERCHPEEIRQVRQATRDLQAEAVVPARGELEEADPED